MSIPAAERCVRRRAVLRRTAGSGAAPAAVRAGFVPPEDRKNPLPAFRSAFSSGRERMLLKEFLAPFRVKKLQTGKAAPAAHGSLAGASVDAAVQPPKLLRQPVDLPVQRFDLPILFMQ